MQSLIERLDPPMTLMKEKDKTYLEGKYKTSFSEDPVSIGRRFNYQIWPKKDDSVSISVVKGYGSYGVDNDFWEAALITEKEALAITGWLTDEEMIEYIDLMFDSGVPISEIIDMFMLYDSVTGFDEVQDVIKFLKKGRD